MALLQLLCAGLLGALQPDLGPSLLQLLAVLLALAGLLALESGEGPNWRLLLRRSLQVVLAALPVALALFVLLPRLEPFTALPGLGRGLAMSGLSDTLAPGGIAALVSNRAAAARVSFASGRPPPLDQRYWRVLVHERFDGERWSSADTRSGGATRAGATLASGGTAPPSAAGSAEGASSGPLQIWLSEASGLDAVPWSGDGWPLSAELRLDRRGVLHHRGSAAQRRLYALASGSSGGGAPETSTATTGSDWRRQPPGPQDLQLPRGANPRLEALAAPWARLESAPERLAAAERWFRSQPFAYSQTPGTLPAQAPLDAFLFERRRGFCGHYASALTALMRAAGVPARVVSGYRGGTWVVPLGGPPYLDLRQSDAHAWSEVWLAGQGWRRIDPSSWLANGGPGVGQRTAAGWSNGGSPITWLQRQWWGLDLAWGRWWLGFDRGRQEALVQRLLGGHQELLGVLVVGAVALGLGGGLAGLRWLGGLAGAEAEDPPRRELDRCLRELARHGMVPAAGETLPEFCRRIGRGDAALAAALEGLVAPYQRWRYAAGHRDRSAARRLAADLRAGRREVAAQLRLRRSRRPTGRPEAGC